MSVREALLCLTSLAWAWQVGRGDEADLLHGELPPQPFNSQVGKGDWSQFGGSPHHNNVRDDMTVPIEWDVESSHNIKWSVPLGSETFATPVVANRHVYIGTNNSSGYLDRYPAKMDLGVLLCFREPDGEFLWQHSCEKLPGGLDHDWPGIGICSSSVVEGDRLWVVSNRGEVTCLDTQGFRDGENDGPFNNERPEDSLVPWDEAHEADVVWSFDMMGKLGVRPHNKVHSSPTVWGNVLFICTSNGVDESHSNIPAPEAPSFMAMDKNTGKVLWTDNSPGTNILHGQWGSPAVGVLGGVPQVLFPGGDGWLYSFRADRWADRKPELLWMFDANPKDSVYRLGRQTRNMILPAPVIYDGLVYAGVGDDPDHGEGPGRLWCIDPTKRGDVSAELVVDQHGEPMPHQRVQATAPLGDRTPHAVPNPNSAVVWQYRGHDRNGDQQIDFDEAMHRTIGCPAIKDGLLVISDFSGIVHCLDAKTGVPYWTHDLLAVCWSTPLICGKNVYVADEDGEMVVFALSADFADSLLLAERPGERSVEPLTNAMEQASFTSPVAANGVLYVATWKGLFAIASDRDAP